MSPTPYAKHPSEFQRLADQLNRDYPPLTLSPEYTQFAQENTLQWLIRLARYKFAARMIQPTDSVLEIGCGAGLGALFLAQHCREVLGIDVDSDELAHAHAINRRDNCTFQQLDVFDMPADLRFDTIVCLDVIEHLTEDQGRKLLDHTRRHLAPTGLLILGTPSRYCRDYQSPLSKAAHVKLYDQPELHALLKTFYARTLAFSMNDELVHTGFHKLAWYYFALAFLPQQEPCL